MNELEKRRQDLLKHTRNIYQCSQQPPAIHPRHGRINTNLEAANKMPSHVIRITISILFFLIFFAIYNQNISFGTLDSQMIIEKISCDLFSQGLPTFIKNFKLIENFRFFF